MTSGRGECWGVVELKIEARLETEGRLTVTEEWWEEAQITMRGKIRDRQG